ncbi:signal transduction histidine kinase [Hamadaea flava]|uniref:histidine kinase n=1 Tax=Hamadaea flava TaxID=1742688 RepID=A0ABV8LZV7_9ACTN|nr:ATP-binding protein [Hamadaea flava]MCP2323497.1 signal transduction histidine kinase [Hamadaea flava]
MTATWKRAAGAARARLGSVRVRTSLAAAVVVLAAVGLAAVGLVIIARHTLTSNIDDAASQRAGQVVAAIKSGDPGLLDQTLRPAAGDQTLVQIVNSSGKVVAASPVLAQRPPILTQRPAVEATTWETAYLQPDSEDPFRIVATTVATDDGSRTVLVAQSLRPVNEAIELISRLTAVGMPILAVVVGAATFILVGRTLRPVEAIRRRVAGITARDLQARVPVPNTQDEIAALAETMNAMLDRLHASADAQRRFVADASHELRSPLAALHVGLELLTPANVTGEDVARLRAETDRISRLVADLLLLARVDEHGLHPRRNDVDLDDIAYRSRLRLIGSRPDVTVTGQVTPVRITGDDHELERAVTNLCDNAARYARTTITLTVTADSTTARVIVDDDGPGVPPPERERIFERFVRLDASRARDDGGTGLGLAITREIAHRHGGTVTVTDSPLGGARFELRLPLDYTTTL